MKIKIIFLDIDGVLNSHKYLALNKHVEEDDRNDIDESTILLLKSIVEKTSAKLVLSSSWRKMLDEKLNPTTKAMKKFIEILNKHNLSLWDKTSDLTKKKDDAVREWLKVHQACVDRFIILDDELNSDWNELTPFGVKTSYYIGLTDIQVKCAIQKLNAVS